MNPRCIIQRDALYMVIRLTSPLPSEGLTPIYLSIYMYIYIYIYISIYLYISIYIYIYIYIYRDMFTYTYTHTHTHIYIYIYIYKFTKCLTSAARMLRQSRAIPLECGTHSWYICIANMQRGVIYTEMQYLGGLIRYIHIYINTDIRFLTSAVRTQKQHREVLPKNK